MDRCIETVKRIFRKSKIYEHNKLFIFEMCLDTKKVLVPNETIIIRHATSKDIPLLMVDKDDSYRKIVTERFHNNSICYVAEMDGIIVCYLWVVFHQVLLNEVHYMFRFGDNEASLIDAYTHKQYRKKGVYKMVFQTSLNELIDRKYVRAFGFVSEENKTSMAVHSKYINAKIFQKIEYRKILGMKKHKVINSVQTVMEI